MERSVRGKNQYSIFTQHTVHPFIFTFKIGFHGSVRSWVLYVFQFLKEFFSGDKGLHGFIYISSSSLSLRWNQSCTSWYGFFCVLAVDSVLQTVLDMQCMWALDTLPCAWSVRLYPEVFGGIWDTGIGWLGRWIGAISSCPCN